MQLTTRTDYALRALLYLSQCGDEPVAAATIADAYGVSRAHLVKVVQALAGAGLVETRSGRAGGVVLNRAPEDIGIGEVVRALEPHFAVAECMSPNGHCVATPACGLTGVLVEAREAFLAVLDRHTLADCVGPRAGALRKLLQIGVRRRA